MTDSRPIHEIAAAIEAENHLEDPVQARTARERGTLERDELMNRLRIEDAHDLAEKLAGCGTPLGLTCACCGGHRTVEVACKRRWCPACAWIVARERIRKYERAADTMKWPLFVTLTVRNTPDPEIIRDLRGWWSKMRRRKLMQDRVPGGISTIEVTEGEGGWHPHLHILADCRWLALHTPAPAWQDSEDVKRQKYDHARLELSALWSQVIGQEQASVLALRKSPGECLRYALKYAVKGSDLINSRLPVAPLIRVLSKSRMLSAFGTMHGHPLHDPEDEKPAAVCHECHNETEWIPDHVLHFYNAGSHDRIIADKSKHITPK